jgi:hypothetical protein
MPEKNEREVLVLRGYLDRAGQFSPLRMRSTPVVRSWPVVEEAKRGSLYDVRAELLDEGGEVLHREPAKVTRLVDCAPGDPRQYQVLAYIGLRDDAFSARLMRAELVLWQEQIPDPAWLDLGLRRVTSRKRSATLSFSFSDPATDEAHLMVVYEWGEGRFEPVYVGAPQERLEVDLSEMPGGERCRFLATYSNGMRSAQAVSDTFELSAIGPHLSIVRPEPGDLVTAGIPVILEGSVLDRERRGGARPEQELWWWVDGEQVGHGPITSVDALSEGGHLVELSYRPEGSKEDAAGAAVEIEAVAGREPLAGDWSEWDPLS